MKINFDECYQFGLGVFETISIVYGKPVLSAWHLERLNHSLRTLGIPQSVCEAEIMDYLDSCAVPDHHALKLMVSDSNKLFTLRVNPYTSRQYHNGFRLAYSQIYRNETSPLVHHKTMNYGENILEKRRANALGADELIFKNSLGQICEGTVSNIFFAQGDMLFTPPVSCGLLPGIMRRFVMEHFPVTEKIMTETDIRQMDECFITNSLMGIMPANCLGQKQFPSRQMAEQCMAVYQKYLGSLHML